MANLGKYIITLCIIVIISIGIYSLGEEANERNFSFVYKVKFDETSGKKFEAWIPLPKSNEVQKISNISINSDIEFQRLIEEDYENMYLYLWSNNGLSEEQIVEVSFDVLRKEHSNVKYSNVNSSNHLSASSLVPIGFYFNDIILSNNLNSKDMRGVYDYVLEGMHYGKPKSVDNEYYKDPWLNENEKYGKNQVSRDVVVELYQISKKTNNNYTFGNGNSFYACDIGVGNCTDYHSYFISLSRTLDVPARFHMGFSIPSGKSGKVGGYHCWADYYIENEGWYPVDISEADKAPEKSDYFFGTVNENRFEMMVGRDFKLKNYNNGLINLFIYPIVEIDDQLSKIFSKEFYYKNI